METDEMMIGCVLQRCLDHGVGCRPAMAVQPCRWGDAEPRSH